MVVVLFEVHLRFTKCVSVHAYIASHITSTHWPCTTMAFVNDGTLLASIISYVNISFTKISNLTRNVQFLPRTQTGYFIPGFDTPIEQLLIEDTPAFMSLKFVALKSDRLVSAGRAVQLQASIRTAA